MGVKSDTYKCRFLGFITLWLLFFPGLSHDIMAQRYFTRTYSVADGLPCSTVNGIVQDTNGLLWFATRRGISRYDGVTWTNFNASGGLSSAIYSFLRIDEKGNIWALSNSISLNIDVYSGSRWKMFNTSESFKDTLNVSAFEVFYEDDDPVIIVGTFNAKVLVWKKGICKVYSARDGLPGKQVNDVKAFGQSVYIATENGISVLRNGRLDNSLNKKFAFPDLNILSLAVEKIKDPSGYKEKIWILGKNWFGTIIDDRFSVINARFEIATNQKIYYGFIYPDGDKGVYFGNYLHLYHWSEKTNEIEYLGRKSGLIGEGATAVLIDREKNTWITGQRGVTCIPFTHFSTILVNDGLYDSEVSSALELSPGKYVFAHDGVLSFYDGWKFDYLYLDKPGENGLIEKRVLDMDQDGMGNLWIAASHLGVARIDNLRKVTWFRDDKGIIGNAVSVAVSKDKQVYAVTYEGLFRFDKGRFEQILFKPESYIGFRKIFFVDAHTLFLATFDKGILELKDYKQTRYIASAKNPQANNVFSFLYDSMGRKWAGTADGLYLVKDSELIKYNSNGLIIDRPVYLILEDKTGNLWFGTDNGIYRWNGKMTNLFTVKDGLSGQEINRDAGFVDHQNNILFGTNNGVTCFHPDFEFDLDKIPPPVVFLQTVIVKTDTFPLSRKTSLSSFQDNLVFTFRAISFSDEKRIFYKCMLEGFDQSWSQEFLSPDQQYRYNNLSPGTYRFCLKARNSLGIWSDPVYSATIIINQPFYFQWWFIPSVLIILILLSYLVFRFILLGKYNSLLEQTVSKRTNELRESERLLKQSNQAKDRFFSIIAHDLKSPFNSIIGYLDLLTDSKFVFSDEEREVILTKLKATSNRTVDLLENLLSWARTQKGDIPLNPQKFDLMLLLNENMMLSGSAAEGKNIRLTKIPNDSYFVFADLNMINTVIRNLLSNAVKFTYPGGNIIIDIRYNGKEIEFSISDDGGGMSPDTVEHLFSIEDHIATKGTNNETGTGLGLILCKDFIRLNRGKLWVKSELKTGSTFFFTLPSEPLS